MTYKLELHAHTSETSLCGTFRASELVRLYKEKGYDGVVITDHLTPDYLADWNLSWDDAVTRYLAGYKAAKEAARAAGGPDIFLGIELRFTPNINDYLVYGASEEFLRAGGDLTTLGIAAFFEKINGTGIYVAQAHPFRNKMTIVKPAYLHGVEIFNGNARHDSRNHIARRWAASFGLVGTSGSDFHKIEDLATGGVLLPERPANEKELAAMLFEKRNFSCISDE